MRVLVTGATGFVGRATCAELLERGHEVVALTRRAGSEPPGTSAVQGDIASEDGAALASAVAEARPECVIHLAAEIASQRSEARIRATNVDGTRRLVEAAQRSGGSPKLVFCSTVVTGEAHGELLEPGKPLPVETPYGRSKQEGERIMAESGLPYAIVRPSHVYGRGGWYEEEFVTRLRQPGRFAVIGRAAQGAGGGGWSEEGFAPRRPQPGRFAVIGRGDNWWAGVRVEDVASALADAAEKAPSGGVYHAVDDEPIRFYDFIALTAKA